MVAVVYWYIYRRPREIGKHFKVGQVLDLFLAAPAFKPPIEREDHGP